MWSPHYVDRLLPQPSNWLPGPASAPRGFTSVYWLCVTALRGENRGSSSFAFYYLLMGDSLFCAVMEELFRVLGADGIVWI